MLPILIVIPCFIISITLFGLAGADILPDAYKWVGVVPLALGTGIFIIREGINEWWYNKNPKRLDKFEQDILEKHFPYYAQLNDQLKADFESRLGIFRMQKSFNMRGTKKVPGDIQLLIGATAIQVTLGMPRPKELFKKLGTIVLFPQTFISPNLSLQHHAVELDIDDPFNCLLLSIDMFVEGLKQPNQYYNIALYGFAKTLKEELKIKDSDIPSPEGMKQTLVKLHQMRGFPMGYVFKYTALGDFELFEMCVEQFFTYPEKLQKYLPEVYAYLMKILLQDPINNRNPVILDVDLAAAEFEEIEKETKDTNIEEKTE
ncbi:MAG: zinc-dependent peptidase [Saprospiraceae bacterium]|nr:zinc-dependent peptidase [Saprospiraceae bacterium]